MGTIAFHAGDLHRPALRRVAGGPRAGPPPGERFSYSNPGYVLAGRVIEVMREMTWNDALTSRLFAPAGLGHSGSGPEEALTHSAALGHLPAPNGGLQPAPIWVMFRSHAPAGATAFCGAADLLAVATILLDSGKASTGSQLVSSDASGGMLTPQISVPTHAYAQAHWGLVISIEKWGEATVVGHDGGTPTGQIAALRLLPDRQVAACVMANSITSARFVLEALDGLLSEHARVNRPRYRPRCCQASGQMEAPGRACNGATAASSRSQSAKTARFSLLSERVRAPETTSSSGWPQTPTGM